MPPLRQVTVNEAEKTALAALSFLAADSSRLARFLDTTGLRPDTIREAAGSAGFLASVLDYVAADEPLLLELAAFLSARPEALMAARHALSPEPIE